MFAFQVLQHSQTIPRMFQLLYETQILAKLNGICRTFNSLSSDQKRSSNRSGKSSYRFIVLPCVANRLLQERTPNAFHIRYSHGILFRQFNCISDTKLIQNVPDKGYS